MKYGETVLGAAKMYSIFQPFEDDGSIKLLMNLPRKKATITILKASKEEAIRNEHWQSVTTQML